MVSRENDRCVVLSELLQFTDVVVCKGRTTDDHELLISDKVWFCSAEVFPCLNEDMGSLVTHETRTHHEVVVWSQSKWLDEVLVSQFHWHLCSVWNVLGRYAVVKTCVGLKGFGHRDSSVRSGDSEVFTDTKRKTRKPIPFLVVTVNTVECHDHLCAWAQELWQPGKKRWSNSVNVEDVDLFTSRTENRGECVCDRVEMFCWDRSRFECRDTAMVADWPCVPSTAKYEDFMSACGQLG